MKILVLASGKGSNFEALLNYKKENFLDAEIISLLTDNPKAGAIEIANQHSIPVTIINFKNYLEDKSKFHIEIEAEIKKLNPDLILLLGYMRILDEKIIMEYSGKVINIHPSLLPAFPGIKSIEQAFNYGVQFTGCTVHFVDVEVDSGPIILQSIIEILPKTTISELTKLIHKEEHKILPLAVDLFCKGKLRIEGRKVIILHD